ncbi:hypothetical protein scyTo_0026080 [Scyliorhinus torazame]|uniref:Uncharacterized protein n=1 Tax=Scyliorhinus torazame TaxID=75743 RepID=A0A401QJ33_SCYTO|nr:hypothetical protein [Scyliorhinus torazame]
MTEPVKGLVSEYVADLTAQQVYPACLSYSPGPMYGTLLKAWHAFLTSADRLSQLHVEIQKSLVTEDTAKILNWQRDTYHKKFFGGFKETHEVKSGFRKAQKPWTKKLKKVRHD